MSTFRGRLTEETNNYTEAATKTIDECASEGEKVVSGIREGKVVEEIPQMSCDNRQDRGNEW